MIKKPIKIKKVHATKEGERFESEDIKYADEEVHIPPNTTAQIFWLKNRRPERWRDKQEEKKTDTIQEILKGIQTMADLARRLLSAGQMTSTAARLIWKVQQAGMHRETVIKKLSALIGMTTRELKTLLQDAVLTSWQDEAAMLAPIGIALSDPLENPRVIEVMDAEYKKSLAELENLTRTTMDKTQQELINLLDETEMRVSAGTQSYNAAVCQVLDEYAGKGIKVKYPTGAGLTLEAAVRLCVVTSMNQTAAQVTNQYVVETGSNYVLFSAHPGARVAREGQPVYAGHEMGWLKN